MRDLKRDLEIISEATPGPWKVERYQDDSVNLFSKEHQLIYGGYDSLTFIYDADMEFIVEAREGWAEAVERAIKAESEAERLKARLQELEHGLLRLRDSMRGEKSK